MCIRDSPWTCAPCRPGAGRASSAPQSARGLHSADRPGSGQPPLPGAAGNGRPTAGRQPRPARPRNRGPATLDAPPRHAP
eukprot:7547073-Pyramimonas_sp.AAC.1